MAQRPATTRIGVEDTSTPVRRAPYSPNPEVGARGLRTQQRILDAALGVFGENGYDRSTLDAIAQLAGCSRVSIYQYFSGKDDIFRHLTGQVARQLRGSIDLLGPLTPDQQGRDALRAWVSRYADIHNRFEPVFRAFGAAAASDTSLAGGAALVVERNVAVFGARVSDVSLPPRQLEVLVVLLLSGVSRSLDQATTLRAYRPEDYGRDRVDDALADAVHRSLFGRLPGVNAHEPVTDPPTPLQMSGTLRDQFDQVAALEAESAQPGRRALAQLLEVGDDVIAGHGYQGTRVEHIVEAAGLSRGAFYRYFDNIDEFVRVIGVRALDDTSRTLADLPDVTDRASLRSWLRRYNETHAGQAAMVSIWMETLADAPKGDRAAIYDWGRRRMARLLVGRTFGDVDIDALLLLAMIEAFGAVPRTPEEVDAVVRIVECGFLGACP